MFKKLRGWIDSWKLNTKFTALIVAVIVVPISVMAGVLYYNMEQNVVEENITYMKYNMERNRSQITTGVDSINMSTQFLLSDSDMKDILNGAVTGKDISTEELLDFYEKDIASVERLINNNPLLYSMRVYASVDNIQEMMPVLYRKSRMEKLSWAKDYENREEKGKQGEWNFGYVDTLFSETIASQGDQLLGMVTPITDYDYGTIGYIEVAMEMETMFPSLYEKVENEWSCFITEEGVYYGDNEPENAEAFLHDLWKQMETDGEENLESVSAATLIGESLTKYYELKGQKYVISYLPVKEMGGTLVSVRDITGDVTKIYRSRNIFVVVAILLLIQVTVLIHFVVNRMLRQMYGILSTISQVKEGNLKARIKKCSGDEMGSLSIELNEMLDRIEKLMQDNINREILAKNSEIRALQNQINAHFIYNVLETIKMMAEIDEKYEISDAITSLGKLLRYSMRWVSGNVKMEDELEYIRNYVALINLRFDYEIILSLNIEEELLQQDIPKMSLQPIVENAILHGIEEVAEDTTIYIKAYAKDSDCIIEITDAGKGMTEDEVEKLEKKIAGEIETGGGSGNGIGLKNVQDRITMAFGEGFGLSVFSQIGCYTKIMVRIPTTVRKGYYENSIDC